MGGLHPCPRCLVPQEFQCRLDLTWPYREAEDAQAIVWEKSLNLGQKDGLLKKLSLRNVEVIQPLVNCFGIRIVNLYSTERLLDSGEL